MKLFHLPQKEVLFLKRRDITMTYLDLLQTYTYSIFLWKKEDTELSFIEWLKSKYDNETETSYDKPRSNKSDN